MEEHLLDKAMEIAARDLRWCYRERGIVSGSRKVYWSWDSYFASFGALSLGDTDIVRKNLELYLALQRPDGALPKRIAHPLYWMRFLGMPVTESSLFQRPTFSNSYFTDQCITQNVIFPIIFAEYIEQTGDRAFLALHYGRLVRSFSYLDKRRRKFGLLHEGVGGGWAESVLKRGAIAFTNMCYARAAQCMANMASRLGEEGDAARFESLYKEVVESINTNLWSENGGAFYSDWLGTVRHHHFVTDGNLLAIWWGIASPAQAQSIQDKIDELHLEDEIPIKLAYDPYSWWRIYIFNRLGGIKDYHVGYSWTWLGCIDVLVKLQMGNHEQALKVLTKIARVIVRDGCVHEAYDGDKWVQTFWYKSEHPWAWGAGIFLYACKAVGLALPSDAK